MIERKTVSVRGYLRERRKRKKDDKIIGYVYDGVKIPLNYEELLKIHFNPKDPCYRVTKDGYMFDVFGLQSIINMLLKGDKRYPIVRLDSIVSSDDYEKLITKHEFKNYKINLGPKYVTLYDKKTGKVVKRKKAKDLIFSHIRKVSKPIYKSDYSKRYKIEEIKRKLKKIEEIRKRKERKLKNETERKIYNFGIKKGYEEAMRFEKILPPDVSSEDAVEELQNIIQDYGTDVYKEARVYIGSLLGFTGRKKEKLKTFEWDEALETKEEENRFYKLLDIFFSGFGIGSKIRFLREKMKKVK